MPRPRSARRSGSRRIGWFTEPPREDPLFHAKPRRRDAELKAQFPHLALIGVGQVGGRSHSRPKGPEALQGPERPPVHRGEEAQVALEEVPGIIRAEVVGNETREILLVCPCLLYTSDAADEN